MNVKTVLITGAAVNLGAKLRRHLEGRYDLRLLTAPYSTLSLFGAANTRQETLLSLIKGQPA